MNESNRELLRLRRWAHGLFVLLVVLLLAKVLWESVNFAFYVRNTMENDPSAMQLGPMDIPMAAIVLAYRIGMAVVALMILRSLWTEETPFLMKIVRRMKALALMLALFEPCIRLLVYCQVRFTGSTNINFGAAPGFFLPVAAVAYCLALVFQYGVILQTQADETL